MTVTNFGPAADSHIEGVFDQNANSGAATQITMGIVDSGGKTFWWRLMFAFDVSSLGPVTVTSAKLKLNTGAGAGGTYGSKLVRIVRTWIEDEATWLEYATGDSWTTAGANHDGDDKDTGTPPQVSWSTPTTGGDFEITGLGAFVQDAIDNRSGIVSMLLHLDDENPGETRTLTVRAKEHSIPTLRPVLEVIDTTVPPPTLTPSTLTGRRGTIGPDGRRGQRTVVTPGPLRPRRPRQARRPATP